MTFKSMYCSMRVSHLQMCSSHNINTTGTAETTHRRPLRIECYILSTYYIKMSPDGWIEEGSEFPRRLCDRVSPDSSDPYG